MSNEYNIAVVGWGPRATYLERQLILQAPQPEAALADMLKDPTKMKIHYGNGLKGIKDTRLSNEEIKHIIGKFVINFSEPHTPGAGAVWDINTPDYYLANTAACQLTACADETVSEAVIDPGPDFDEWLENNFEDFLDAQFQRWLDFKINQAQTKAKKIEVNDDAFKPFFDFFESQSELKLRADELYQQKLKKNQTRTQQYSTAMSAEYDSWKNEKFEKWFNGKAYGDESKFSFFSSGKPVERGNGGEINKRIHIHSDYCSPRFMYGMYLNDMATNMENTPENVDIRYEKRRIIDLYADDKNRTSKLIIENDERHPDEYESMQRTVLTVGHSVNKPNHREQERDDFVKEYGGPLKHAYAHNFGTIIEECEPRAVIGIEGMGLTSFDVVSAATEGKGGEFHRDENGKLVYKPSGLEPKLYVGSTTGVPFSGRGENQKGKSGQYKPVFFKPERVAELRAIQYHKRVKELDSATGEGASELKDLGYTAANMPLDFWNGRANNLNYSFGLPIEELLPPINPRTGILELDDEDILSDLFRDMEHAFYRSTQGDKFGDRYLKAARNEKVRHMLLKSLPRKDRYDFKEIFAPFDALKLHNNQLQDKNSLKKQFSPDNALEEAEPFESPEELQKWIHAYIRKDLEECKKGNTHGKKAAAEVWRDCRNTIREIFDFNGVEAHSQKFLGIFERLHNRLVSGPPAHRLEEWDALSEAGILTFMGPRMEIECKPFARKNGGKFVISSPCVKSKDSKSGNQEVCADIVINAHQDKTSILKDLNPLIQNINSSPTARGTLQAGFNEDPFTSKRVRTGGANITRDFEAIGRGGEVREFIIAPGMIASGKVTYQNNAARPMVESTSIKHMAVVAQQISSHRMELIQKYALKYLKEREANMTASQTLKRVQFPHESSGDINLGHDGVGE